MATVPQPQPASVRDRGRSPAIRYSLLLPVAPVILTACLSAASLPATQARVSDDAPAEIAGMLGDAARAWNAGDLDAFMGDFAQGSGTTFIGSRGVLRGPDQIRAAYAPRFATGAQRDSLRFEDLEVHSLAPGVAYVIAYYVLHRGDSTTARGPTSLVMRRTQQGWRIVHDHSS
jgi:uncharacterized protein (TIGR02246 family)